MTDPRSTHDGDPDEFVRLCEAVRKFGYFAWTPEAIGRERYAEVGAALQRLVQTVADFVVWPDFDADPQPGTMPTLDASYVIVQHIEALLGRAKARI